MTAQATLFDFAPKALPIKASPFDHHPHRTIYRTNAEAVVKDLGQMPSGAGIWPSLHANTNPEWNGGCDITSGQYRGSGGILKRIWADGRVEDHIQVEDGWMQISETWIEGDLMHIVGVDGIERTLDIEEDSECRWWDVHPFDPADIVEHYAMLALSKGLRGDDIMAIARISSYCFDTVWPSSEAMDIVWSTIPLTGVVPKLDQKVRHITEYMDICPAQCTCATCTRKRPNKGCQCGNNPDVGYCYRNYVWDGTSMKVIKRSHVTPCDEDDDMEDCCA